MLVGEVLQRIVSLYSKGVQSDDARLTYRHAYNKLLSSRAKYLIQKAKKRQQISTWCYQTLSCVKVIDVPITECPCLPISGCTVKRSEYKLPKPITGLINNNIDWILSLDGSIRFDESTRAEMLHIKGNKYTSGNYRYVIDKGYAYFYGKNVPRVVQVRMLCEDPVEAIKFIDACGECEECVDIFDMEFPMESGYIDYIIEDAVKELIGTLNPQIEDVKNNASAQI